MNTVSRLSKVGAAVALVFAVVAPQLARADAVAQSILDISNFTFRIGNTAAGVGSTLVGDPRLTLSPAVAGNQSAVTLLGSASQNGSDPNLSTSKTGPDSAVYNSSFAPIVAVNPFLPGTFSGSTAKQSGNAVTGSATARTDDVVSLRPTGQGTAQSTSSLSAEFGITVQSNGIAPKLEIAFSASDFLRAYLTDPGSALASNQWSVNLCRVQGVNQCDGIFSWTPDGFVNGNVVGGVEYADAFNMGSGAQVNTNTPFNSIIQHASGFFEVETSGLTNGQYKLNITHQSSANALLVVERVPEPGTISLIALALLGAGAMSRRRRNV